jgi:putative DNA primase/helicase
LSEIIDLEGWRDAAVLVPAFSEEALALSFADRHADDLRYVAAQGKWLHWTGKRWQYDETLKARRCVRLICRAASVECNSKAKNIIASAKTVSGVERLAQADPRLAATLDQWDADPWLLNTPSETIDLRSGDTKPHDTADYLTKVTGIAPAGRCPIPTWQSFLDRVTTTMSSCRNFYSGWRVIH